MPMHCEINGAKREIKELYCGVGGAKKSINEMWAGIDGVKKQIFSSAVEIGSLPVGSVLKVMEVGTPTNYIVVQQGIPEGIASYKYENCDGTWLMRKDVSILSYYNLVASNVYADGLHDRLNTRVFLGRYPDSLVDNMLEAKIPFWDGTGTSGSIAYGDNGLLCKLFVPSGTEVGFSRSGFMPSYEGNELAYFESGTGSAANAKRICNYNGVPSKWHTRSPVITNDEENWGVSATGSFTSNSPVTDEMGVRQMFILPKTYKLDSNVYLE